jgi:TatD DNase family protein
VSERLDWFDHHCHLSDERLGVEAAGEAMAADVVGMITVGCSVEDSRRQIEIAQSHQFVWATAGVHPHDAKQGWDGLEDLLGLDRVVAVGECGLDYHYDNSPRQAQRESFVAQIHLAHDHELPLVIHSRSAWDETFAILRTEGVPARTVFHCFTGGVQEAEIALALDTQLSFSGIVTFQSAQELQAAAVICPLDRMLVETDSPYLAPVPHRGKQNTPAYVALVGKAVAALKGVSADVVAAATTANACSFYGIPKSDLRN